MAQCEWVLDAINYQVLACFYFPNYYSGPCRFSALNSTGYESHDDHLQHMIKWTADYFFLSEVLMFSAIFVFNWRRSESPSLSLVWKRRKKNQFSNQNQNLNGVHPTTVRNKTKNIPIFLVCFVVLNYWRYHK